MIIEKIPIEKLILDPCNVRKHNEKNLHAIKGSLARFGQTKPIVVNNENIVIAGNGTLEAARALGWSEINIVRTTLAGAEATAYAIADNRTSELASWDMDSLRLQLEGLEGEGFDLSEIGFDVGDWDKKPDDESDKDPDEVPDVDDNPYGAQTGDIWQLGNHRLMCGDSTKIEDVEKLMGGEKADMVFTDPPYNHAEKEKLVSQSVRQ